MEPNIFDKMQAIDRRWVFLMIALAVIIPFAFKLTFREVATPEVKAIYNLIDKLPKGSPVLLALDFDPPSEPELKPMAYAYARHLALKGHKIYMITLWPVGQNEIVDVVSEVLNKEFPPHHWVKGTQKVNPWNVKAADLKKLGFKGKAGKDIKAREWLAKGFKKVDNPKGYKNGRDYVKLGFKAGNQGVINTILYDFKELYTTDADSVPVNKIPMMAGIKNLKDMKLILNVSAGFPGLKEWVQFGGDTSGVPVAGGVTAVSAPLLYPYYPKQLKGLMGGLKAAAEYESLLLSGYKQLKGKVKAKALSRMGPQTVAHLVIILFILIGNIAYFLSSNRAGRGPRLRSTQS
jgi:hypothetical protein